MVRQQALTLLAGGSLPSAPAIIIEASPSGKATDSDSVIRWFESISPYHFHMYPKPPFRVHVSAICTQKHCFGYTFRCCLRAKKKDGSSINYPFVRKDSLTLEISGSFIAWDPEYGKTLEYPFFVIGEIVPCWVQSVEPGDKSCTLKLVNYDSRIFE